MTRFLTIAVTALGIAASATAPARAAPISSLEECYTAVINWCVSTFPDHADECGSASGLDDCDDEFGNTTAAPGLTLRAPSRHGPAISPRTFQRLMAGAPRAATPSRVLR
ncbi:hypothetical protein JI664_12145 [Rhodobacter sp. NTK016B]|uniref:hypothetical protein n=1 Tax=Rhodobacter sp. NTK016B TaxID=2759676 RepID=UPI001A8D3DEC|nr:hypothetical protein [Rhodobacter sp. NTK016B]MBN8292716.1 hypothetical protein [Rhodobacter sp. NTK016B]